MACRTQQLTSAATKAVTELYHGPHITANGKQSLSRPSDQLPPFSFIERIQHTHHTLEENEVTAGSDDKTPYPVSYLLPYLQELLCRPSTIFLKGIFKPIQADRISLPPPRRPIIPNHSGFWIRRLPSDVIPLFTSLKETTFTEPLLQHFLKEDESPQNRKNVPTARTHATKMDYLHLIDRAQYSGILTWSTTCTESKDYSILSPCIQMSLFAVTKDKTSDRLISWPRIQNALFPDTPLVSLPNPGLFDHITCSQPPLSSINMDIQNMFHNISLPRWLSLLFPWQLVKISEVSPYTLDAIKEQLNMKELSLDTMLRPLQATMPMGLSGLFLFPTLSLVAVFENLTLSYAALRSPQVAPQRYRYFKRRTHHFR